MIWNTKFTRRGLHALMAVLVLAALGGPARAGNITGIVSFGDSLSDTGNTYLAAGTPTSPPYYNGHYSNGPIWLEYLAKGLGVATPTPSLAGGLDNAWGGAQTGVGTSVLGTPNIGTQIATFLATHGLSSGELITLWGGANDFLHGVTADPTVPVANLASEITTLAGAGGKDFMVANLPLLGELPATNGLPQAQRDALNFLATSFNSLLHNELNTLQTTLGITIHQLDVATLFEGVMADPSKYGFSNVTGALMDSADPTAKGYLFWDSVHPTTEAQQLIGQAAMNMVPEPSSITLLLIAAPGLLAWKGRTAVRAIRRAG